MSENIKKENLSQMSHSTCDEHLLTGVLGMEKRKFTKSVSLESNGSKKYCSLIEQVFISDDFTQVSFSKDSEKLQSNEIVGKNGEDNEVARRLKNSRRGKGKGN